MNSYLPIVAHSVAAESGSTYPDPFNSRIDGSSWRVLGDQFGITQIGFNLEVLEPGGESSIRYWHTLSDESIYMLEGHLTLRVNDDDFSLVPGMFVGFRAGSRYAHSLANRSSTSARFIVVGSRVPGDNTFYPYDDLTWFRTESGRVASRKNGQPYSESDQLGKSIFLTSGQ